MLWLNTLQLECIFINSLQLLNNASQEITNEKYNKRGRGGEILSQDLATLISKFDLIFPLPFSSRVFLFANIFDVYKYK